MPFLHGMGWSLDALALPNVIRALLGKPAVAPSGERSTLGSPLVGRQQVVRCQPLKDYPIGHSSPLGTASAPYLVEGVR